MVPLGRGSQQVDRPARLSRLPETAAPIDLARVAGLPAHDA